MEIFDNVKEIVRDDLTETIKRGSKVSMAAACFSIYAFAELKKQLKSVDELRFIFTSPAFIQEQADKQKREFYIPRLNRERSLFGTEFEIKLRNEMTQKAIAQECVEWIKKKVRFKSNRTDGKINSFMNVDGPDTTFTYMPLDGLTTTDIGCDRGDNISNMVARLEVPNTADYINLFDTLWNDETLLEDVTETVIRTISNAFKEYSPEYVYFLMLYNIFSEFLEDISEDHLPNDATGFKESVIWNKLFDFQKDAVLAIINKLEKYNGCILADSVGLGKTFSALAVIKYYENRNKSVLVLCPKKLAENWNTYKENYHNNQFAKDRFNYTVLFHTDLSRDDGRSNGIDLGRINWGNFDLVVIDESHNFRNGLGTHYNTKENRYKKLMDEVIRAGVKTKVLMLSATPVNNRFNDLKNQIALAYEGNEELLSSKLETEKTIDSIFRQAQKAFNVWSKLKPEDRTTEALLKRLDFDFFELLDSVTIARSRRHIEKYYDTAAIGQFPQRLKPITRSPSMTDQDDAIKYDEIFDQLMSLRLSVYHPSKHIFDSRRAYYLGRMHNKEDKLTQEGREAGMQSLMTMNLMKRLESSVHSFRETLSRVLGLINHTLDVIREFEKTKKTTGLESYEITDDDFDVEDTNTDYFTVGKKVKIDLADMDYTTWQRELEEDAQKLELLRSMVADITPEHDLKLRTLFELIDKKISEPINGGNKKILIFTAFADTAEYLYDQISAHVRNKYGLESALITGTAYGKTTIKGLRTDLNTILTCFSPKSKERDAQKQRETSEIDVLVATDCISEGQNLQDCDYLVNYDIHWNPVRIIQRFGRIDRIGSRNQAIQLVNFWPDMPLENYIRLKSRVETKMKATVMASTGDDDLLNEEEKGDLEYRRQQLKRLQEEVVDLEEMSTGVSIVDLGLNEFRLDLLEFLKKYGSLDRPPKGVHAIVPADKEHPAGIIFLLRNVNDTPNSDNKNQLYPHYLVYVDSEGEVVCDYLSPKKLLDAVRYLCRGKADPYLELCRQFNEETKDGWKMEKISQLLYDAVNSIIDTKEESDIDSLFTPGGTTALLSDVKGLEDFELVCFLVIKKG
ncbi:MAG: DEAD/DEAH box helicase family protein [Thermoguttaceae bacterium]|nr:DEAD/DEAH box helicase family protein [Thermoguttaceae bacterium]